MTDSLQDLSEEELAGRLAAIQDRLRPLERELAAVRAERDVVLTERRRRERLQVRDRRREVRAAVAGGAAPTIAELVATATEGALDSFRFNLRTGGEVRLGFPGARSQTLTFTDGAVSIQARDLAEAALHYEAGLELGTPGRPGVRIHFPGSRQEKLVDAGDVFATAREAPQADGPNIPQT